MSDVGRRSPAQSDEAIARRDVWRAVILAPQESAAAQRREEEHAAQIFWAMVQTVQDRERRAHQLNAGQPPALFALEPAAPLAAVRPRSKSRRQRGWREL